MGEDFTIVVLGHKSHGKSSLIEAVLNLDSETDGTGLKTVNHMKIKDGLSTVLIDIPGTRRFLKNCLRWTLQADYAVLVVAADDGVMPQTKEFIEVVKYSGVKKGVVVITKTDKVDEEIFELASMEVEEAVADTVFSDKEILPFSKDDKDSAVNLFNRIGEDLDCETDETVDSKFRFFVDNTMSFQGFGTVVTGKVLSGEVSKDETLYVCPGNIKTRVRSVEVHKRKENKASGGQRAGICLSGVQLSEIKSGAVLLKEPLTDKRVFINSETVTLTPLKSGQRVKIYHGTSVFNAFIVVLEGDEISPGEKSLVQLRINGSTAVNPGDRFVISSMNTQNISGGGRILEVSFEKFRSSKSVRTIPYLKAVMENNSKESVNQYIKRNLNGPSEFSEIKDYSLFTEKEVRSAIDKLESEGKLIKIGSDAYYLKENYDNFLDGILKITKEYFARNPLSDRINLNEIKAKLNRDFDNNLLKLMIEDLCIDGLLRKSQSGYSLARKPDKLTKELENLQQIIVSHAKNKGFLTFSIGSFLRENSGCSRQDVQKLLDRLENQKVLIKLNNDNFLLREVIGDIKDKVARAIEEKGKINLTHSMEIVGYGRAKAAPVFEYLDDIGFTRREGNERYLNR